LPGTKVFVRDAIDFGNHDGQLHPFRVFVFFIGIFVSLFFENIFRDHGHDFGQCFPCRMQIPAMGAPIMFCIFILVYTRTHARFM
jgi:hypothetical protein